MGEYQVKIIDPEKLIWEEIETDILHLENQAFGKHSYDEQELRNGFTNPKNIAVVLLKDKKVIGFMYAVPIIRKSCRSA